MTIAPERVTRRKVVTTEELKALVEAGHLVRLPEVVHPAAEVLGHYESQEVARLDVSTEDNPVVSVTYVGHEPVQCIAVDHPRHLYITDDFIPTHNTSNIVFLKSTDDSMLDTLQKMSGTRHVSYIDSKTVTRDQERIVKGMNVEGKVSYTMSTKEEPVISYNDMAFISERQSIVFRAGDAPVWNRNETILPMSWRLFRDTIIHPGHDYSLRTIPTLSSALDFDVRMNQPDFFKMLSKRMEQAITAQDSATKYQEAYGYSDVDITRLDPDVYSDQVMELVDAQLREEFAFERGDGVDPDYIDPDELAELGMAMMENATDDAEVRLEVAKRQAQLRELEEMRYAGKQVSREMLVNPDGTPKQKSLDKEFVAAYKATFRELQADTSYFTVDAHGALRSADGRTVYISKVDETEAMRQLEEAHQGEGRVFTEDPEVLEQLGSYRVHPEFYGFLASLPSWNDIARGEWERTMSLLMRDE